MHTNTTRTTCSSRHNRTNTYAYLYTSIQSTKENQKLKSAITTRAFKHTETNRNDFLGKYPLLYAYTAMGEGNMVLVYPKIVLTQLHKSTRTPLSDATRCPPPASLYIGPHSSKGWGCGLHYTTLTSPSSRKVKITHYIQTQHYKTNSIKQTSR